MTACRCPRCHSDRIIYASSIVSPGDEMELLQDIYDCHNCGQLIAVDCRTGRVVLDAADALKAEIERAVQTCSRVAQGVPR